MDFYLAWGSAFMQTFSFAFNYSETKAEEEKANAEDIWSKRVKDLGVSKTGRWAAATAQSHSLFILKNGFCLCQYKFDSNSPLRIRCGTGAVTINLDHLKMDTELLQKSISDKRNSGMIQVQPAVERTVWVAGLPAKGAFKCVCL